MEYKAVRLDDLPRIARDILALCESTHTHIIALEGDLGSGKTAFVKNIATILGVTERVASPTFVIQKIYSVHARGFETMVHIDAYRIEHEDEMKTIGWDAIIANQKNLILIEWPERLLGLIPPNTIHVVFKWIDETTRAIGVFVKDHTHEHKI